MTTCVQSVFLGCLLLAWGSIGGCGAARGSDASHHDGPFVNDALIPAGSAGFSSDLVRTTTERPVSSAEGSFRVVCDYSHMKYDDPIAYPGEPGKSHLHAFFGNTAVDAFSTGDSIATSGNSTCVGGTANRSAYWAPALIDTKEGRPLVPAQAIFYYKTGAALPGDVQPLPWGLRMIAGDHTNAGPLPVDKYDITQRWSCEGASPDPGFSSAIINCPVGSLVVQQVFFPQCWDGVNLDSPNHKSHMAYLSGAGAKCQADHPIPVPQITFNLKYQVKEANAPLRWRLASDHYDQTLPGGYSSHADWVNGWKADILKTWVTNCENPSKDCHASLLGDGREIWSP